MCLFAEGMSAKEAEDARRSLFRAPELRDSVCPGPVGACACRDPLWNCSEARWQRFLHRGDEAGLLFTRRLAVQLVWLQA